MLAFLFCMSKDHAQLLIMHAYIRNGNGTAGMNGATASERDGIERKRHRFFYSYCICIFEGKMNAPMFVGSTNVCANSG